MTSILNKIADQGSTLNVPSNPIKEIVSSPEIKRITLTDVIKSATPQKPNLVASNIIEPVSKQVDQMIGQVTRQVTDQATGEVTDGMIQRNLGTKVRELSEKLQKDNVTQPIVVEDDAVIERLRPKVNDVGSKNNLNDVRGTGVRDKSTIFDFSKTYSLPGRDTQGNPLDVEEKIETKRVDQPIVTRTSLTRPSVAQAATATTTQAAGNILDTNMKPEGVSQEPTDGFSNMLEKIKKNIESQKTSNIPEKIDQQQSILQKVQSQLLPNQRPSIQEKDIVSSNQSGIFNIYNIQMACPNVYDLVQMDKNAKSLVSEKIFFEGFTDDQLNRIGLDRNIPDVIIYPKERKIQMILSDPNRLQYNNAASIPLNDMSIGDLLYVAAKEKIPVHLIPDRYNVRRILVPLILYQRKRSDLIQHNLLTDDDLRTIVYVIQSGNEIEYSWILKRCDLEKIIDTGSFPNYTNEFVPRWRRYEILKILPQPFLQSVSFQLASSDLAMVPTDNYIIARLIDLSENPFEAIYAKNRNVDREFLKERYGLIIPRTWDNMDYIGLNGPFYPLRIPNEPFSVERLLTMGTKSARRDYLSKYHDIVLLQEIKNYVPYNGRTDLIENILNVFDSTEDIYFVCLVPQLQGKIYYGNYSRSEVYSQDTLASKLDFLTTQNYPLEDKLEILKKTRQLQTLLLNTNMMTPKLAASISRLITTYEENADAQPLLYYFLLLDAKEISNIRKLYYQKFYYDQTRNCLYSNMIPNAFVNKLPKLYNINRTIPRTIDPYSTADGTSNKAIHDSNDDLYDTIAYMKLFFGYVPHSIRNFGMS